MAPSASARPENSGLTPIMLAAGVTGSVSVRSTARPPDSAMRTAIFASSGWVLAGGLSRLTVNFALPASSVAGRSSSVVVDRLDLLVGEAELITGKARPLLGRRRPSRRLRDRARPPARRRGNARRPRRSAGAFCEILALGEVRSNSMRSGT